LLDESPLIIFPEPEKSSVPSLYRAGKARSPVVVVVPAPAVVSFARSMYTVRE